MSVALDPQKGERAARPAPRSLFARYANPAHKKAAKVLGYALTLDTGPAWLAASALWQARLTPQNAATIAWAGLTATDPDLAELVVTEALGGAGMPLPGFGDVMEDARWWADMATADERAAYAVACFNRFSALERDEFRAFVRGK